MPFFGLFWAASWFSCFIASSENLLKVPDYFASAFPVRVFSVVDNPIELPTHRAFPTQLSPEVWTSQILHLMSSAIVDPWEPSLNIPPLARGATGVRGVVQELNIPALVNIPPLARGARGVRGVVQELRFSNFSVATIPNLAFQIGAGSPLHQPQQIPTRPSSDRNRPENTFCRSKSDRKDEKPVATPPSSSGQETSATFPQQLLQVLQNLLPWRQRSELHQQKVASSVKVVSTHAGERIGDKQKVPHLKQGLWHYTQRLAGKAVAAVPPTDADEQFQVWVKRRLIAQFPQQQQAEVMAQQLKQFFLKSANPIFNTASIEPTIVGKIPAVKAGDRLLFRVDDDLATGLNRNREVLAIEWANNLRTALGKEPLTLAEAQKRMHNLVETSKTFKGQASWYGSQFHGRLTATGETYDRYELTAAHPSLPFHTYLKVRNLKSGDSVIVRINDRGPFVPNTNRNLDLSLGAARCINSEEAGVIPFEAEIMKIGARD